MTEKYGPCAQHGRFIWLFVSHHFCAAIGCLHPPYITKAKNDGLKSLVTSYDIVKLPGGGAAIAGFRTDFIKAHPKEITAFIKAVYETHQWINAHVDDAVKLEAKRLNMAPKNVQPFHYDENTYVKKAYAQTWLEYMEEEGLIQKGQVKTTDIYTNQYNPYHLAND